MSIPRAVTGRSPVLELVEAEGLLPKLRPLVSRINRRVAVRRRLEREIQVLQLINETTRERGPDLDELVDLSMRYHQLGGQIDALVERLASLGCSVRDRDASCVDFTCLRDDGLAVFCWREGEAHVAHWHPMHEPHSTRRPLDVSLS